MKKNIIQFIKKFYEWLIFRFALLLEKDYFERLNPSKEFETFKTNHVYWLLLLFFFFFNTWIYYFDLLYTIQEFLIAILICSRRPNRFSKRLVKTFFKHLVDVPLIIYMYLNLGVYGIILLLILRKNFAIFYAIIVCLFQDKLDLKKKESKILFDPQNTMSKKLAALTIAYWYDEYVKRVADCMIGLRIIIELIERKSTKKK